ncbi:MAG: hypothetical protein AAF990_25255 [Bacteroidota bacterium]
MILNKKYIIAFLVILINSSRISGQGIKLKDIKEFEFSITAECQICDGFGKTEFTINRYDKQKPIYNLKRDGNLENINITKRKIKKVVDSLIRISDNLEFKNFNNYDSLFNSLVPKEQNKYGFPEQLIRIDDGICYSIKIKLDDRFIEAYSCNPEQEYDLIKKYSRNPNKEILDLLEGVKKILICLRKEVGVKI